MNPLFPFNGTRHLGEAELLPAAPCCPLCSAAEPIAEFRLQAVPDVDLRSCWRCGGASVSRMPTEEALGSLYGSFYPDGAEAQVTFGNLARFGRQLFRCMVPLAARGRLRILDFGGGDGSISLDLAARLHRAGVTHVELVVLDRIGDLVETGEKGITISRQGRLADCMQLSFDIVIASGVLEHVTEPVQTLQTLSSKLCDGGRLYARTPHVLPYMRLSRQRAVEHFFPYPAHLHDMGQRFWEFAFDAGLAGEELCLIKSRPAIVQVSFQQHALVALASHAMKAPWHLLGSTYPYVGGWEVLAEKS